MKVKVSVLVICFEAIIYLLLYNLHDCTFNKLQTLLIFQKSIFLLPVSKCLLTDIPLMASKMVNDNNSPVDTGRKLIRPGRLLKVLCTFSLRPVSTGSNNEKQSNEEQIYNTLDQNDNTIIGISYVLNILKTKVIALKMFVTDQLYLLKQSVGSTKTLEYNTSSDFHIKSLIKQIDYLKEEKKTKNYII